MAHKKGQGSSRNGRDSKAQRRGVKVFGGQEVLAGNVLVRQVGSSFHAGQNVGIGSDFTLWARIDGIVKYERWGKTRQRISVYTPGDVRLSAASRPLGEKRVVKAKPNKGAAKPAAKPAAAKPA